MLPLTFQKNLALYDNLVLTVFLRHIHSFQISKTEYPFIPKWPENCELESVKNEYQRTNSAIPITSMFTKLLEKSWVALLENRNSYKRRFFNILVLGNSLFSSRSQPLSRKAKEDNHLRPLKLLTLRKSKEGTGHCCLPPNT